MALSPHSRNAKPGRTTRTGPEKMQMSHQRTRKAIERIQKEAAERVSLGKPVHPKIIRRG